MPAPTTTRHGRREGEITDRITIGNHTYQLGAEIGRGGFAVVFQAFNVGTGDFYAVKRFPLQAIDNESLSSIEAEIELMKKLNHPNIVKYVDTGRTENYLYMENGSLQNVIRKFGSVSESLAAIYIVQVLAGLKYLHEQGVLHRDIKGANILTSKDGLVKLADFGVALKLSDAQTDDHDVVGTPYWMAPEIIEMSTPTYACDIWSVGCTAIELLTGKPPYFDLSPMAALFRIVQDDYPPFPDGVSPALSDFLLSCFRKEPAMRMSAEKLLDHPWIKNSASLHSTKPVSDIVPPSIAVATAKSKNDEESFTDIDAQSIVNTIRVFQKNVKNSGVNNSKSELSISLSPNFLKTKSIEPIISSNNALPSSGKKSLAQWRELDLNDETGFDFDVITNPSTSVPLLDNSASRTLTVSQRNVDQEALADMENFLGDKDDGENTWNRNQPPQGLKGKSHIRSNTGVVVGLAANLAKYQEKNEDEYGDLENSDSAENIGKLGQLSRNDLSKDNLHRMNMKNLVTSEPNEHENIFAAELQLKLKNNSIEPETEGFDEFLNYQFEEHDFEQDSSKDVHVRRSRTILQIMEAIKPDSPETDVVEKCNELLTMFDSFPEQREHLITHYGVLPILDMLEARSGLRPNIPVLDMLEARSGSVRPHVLRVINKIVEGSVRAQEQLSLVGLIPIVMRLLDYSFDPKSRFQLENSNSNVDPVALEAGRFVHQISSTSNLTLQMLIGAGGLPVLVHMVGYSYQMRPQSHLTSLSLNQGKKLTPAINAAEDARIMVYMGIDCITQVFSVQSSRTRDFCRLFVKLGLLPHLSIAFKYVMGLSASKPNSRQNVVEEKFDIADTIEESYFNSSSTQYDSIAYEVEETLQCKYAHRIATIFWNFSRYEIAEQMGNDGVLDVIIAALKSSGLTDPIGKFRHLYDKRTKLSASYIDIVELLLKCIKNLSMEPSAFTELEHSGAIGTLIPLLNGPIKERCMNHVLPCMFNLCRINKRRQEQAATQGLIPHLQRLITDQSHLRQFALPILCDLAHTSAITRTELWKNDGVVFFIDLLQEKFWQIFALNSLAVWLSNDLGQVEGILTKPSNLSKLIDFFRNATTQTINTIHKPLLDMMSKSKGLSRSLGCSGLFITSLVKRLRMFASEAIVLRSLLKMLQFIHQCHPFPRQLVLDHNLYGIVRSFSQEEGQVLVNQMANRLLRDFQASTLT